MPAGWLAVVGWTHRWLADDAFINFRVLAQVGAGNGPVYNAGDRVEAGTSPAWTLLLGVVHAISRVRLEWVAVLLGLTLSVSAVLLGAAAASRLHCAGGRGRSTWAVPVGAVLFVCPAAVWEWSTGGLETGLSWFWLAAAFLTLVGALQRPDDRGPALWASFVAGLGVLVRPDFAVYSLAFGGVVVATSVRARGARRTLAVLAAGLGLPVVLEVLRMGYYGQLLPNPVYAKDGERSWWAQGLRYARDFGATYWLLVPLGVLVVAGGWCLWRQRHDRALLRVVATVELAALAHVALVMRVGGDYMHARLLVVPWFAVLLPVFVVPWRGAVTGSGRRGVRVVGAAAAGAALAGWSVVATIALRPPGVRTSYGATSGFQPYDERAAQIAGSGVAHPVDVADHLRHLVGVHPGAGDDLVAAWYPLGLGGLPVGPLRADVRQVPYVPSTSAGAVAYSLPTRVDVIDLLGLADRLTARVVVPAHGIPGHEKTLSAVWTAARLLDPRAPLPAGLRGAVGLLPAYPSLPRDPAALQRQRVAAGHVLGCGDVARLLATSQAPLTPRRFLSNLWDAVALDGVSIPPDPVAAERRFCR